MKKLILAILLLTVTLTAYSQNVKPDSILENDYSSNYLGTWSWKKKNDKFRLNLIKANLTNGIRLITGSYLYIVNSKEVVNASMEDGTFWILGDIPRNSTVLTIAVIDKLSGKQANATLTLLDNNTIKWKLTNAGVRGQDSSFSIPSDITLIKHN